MLQKKVFGLIGNNLGNTFSKDYFTQKFNANKLPHIYENFSVSSIEAIEDIFKINDLAGLNITKPYKESVIPYLDELAPSASDCSAVNCIEILSNGKRIGHNTDRFGFQKSLLNFIGSNRNMNALVIGDGGAAKAVISSLNILDLNLLQVTRKPNLQAKQIAYASLKPSIIAEHLLIIQCTPVGMFPQEMDLIPLPYEGIGSDHYCYDLIYLPAKSSFLLAAEKNGAKIKNGLEMLHLQADEAYHIWMNQETF